MSDSKGIKRGQAIIKRDKYSNWEKCFGGKYIPVENTIIIMDMPDNTIQLRLGDGETLIENLPNILDANNKQDSLSNASVKEEVLHL